MGNPFNLPEYFGYRNLLCMRSENHVLQSNFFVPQYAKISRELLRSFRIFEISKFLMHITVFLRLFLSHSTEKFLEEPSKVSERFKCQVFKSFLQKNGISVSIPENFWKVEVVTHEIFQYCEAKKIKGESRYTATEHKSLRRPKDSETKRDSLPSFVGSIREKNSTEKCDITLLGMKFFDSRIFLIYRSVPQRNFSAL